MNFFSSIKVYPFEYSNERVLSLKELCERYASSYVKGAKRALVAFTELYMNAIEDGEDDNVLKNLESNFKKVLCYLLNAYDYNINIGDEFELVEELVSEIKRGNENWRDIIFYCWEYFQEQELEETLSWFH